MFNTIGIIGENEENQDILELMSCYHIVILKGSCIVTHSAEYRNQARFLHTKANTGIDEFLKVVDGPIFVFNNYEILKEIDLQSDRKRTIISNEPVATTYLNLEILSEFPTQLLEEEKLNALKISGGTGLKSKLKLHCILNEENHESEENK